MIVALRGVDLAEALVSIAEYELELCFGSGVIATSMIVLGRLVVLAKQICLWRSEEERQQQKQEGKTKMHRIEKPSTDYADYKSSA